MQKVLFWHGAIGNKGIIEENKDVINTLLNNPNHPGLNLERLGSSKVFSARINKKSRLIFTSYKDEFGNNCLLVLDVIENHEYSKCKFLDNSVIKKFLNINEGELAEQANSLFKPIKTLPDDFDNICKKYKEPWQSQRADFLYEKFIILNEQQELSQTARLPLLISGLAGSGKTTVLLLILKQMQLQVNSYTKHLYYATRDKYLSKSYLVFCPDCFQNVI